ncbi:hypothetical protein CBR_g32325 [Chara braunii]|uniref:Uncharacterized protein n=1 Tax=Chara braunii TaxID=69332 RepID=A0A388JNN0_CHABU|nr:hypothetical protein CBR_g32325 [Chara braunii]|eukprot:GBG59312.1 hypothetical protein CBR_g32325 [Chara braunii]
MKLYVDQSDTQISKRVTDPAVVKKILGGGGGDGGDGGDDGDKKKGPKKEGDSEAEDTRQKMKLGVEAMSAQAVKDVAEVSEMLLKGTTVDQDIVEVDENVLLQDVPEDVVHSPLEGSGCFVDAKTKSSIRFASKEDGCTPRGNAGFNETQSQELLKLTLEFGGLGDQESVGCLVVNTIVRHKLDGVLDVAHRWDANAFRKPLYGDRFLEVSYIYSGGRGRIEILIGASGDITLAEELYLRSVAGKEMARWMAYICKIDPAAPLDISYVVPESIATRALVVIHDRQTMCIDILVHGHPQSFVDFFMLSHPEFLPEAKAKAAQKEHSEAVPPAAEESGEPPKEKDEVGSETYALLRENLVSAEIASWKGILDL